MSNKEEGTRLSNDRIILIVVSVLLVIAIGYIAISNLSSRSPSEAEPAVLPGTAPPVEPEEAEIEPTEEPAPADAGQEATPTVVRRLELLSTPTPFHVTGEEDVRSILDLSNPDYVDYFDDPETWFDYDFDNAAYFVTDSHLFGKDPNPEDTATYWSFNDPASGNVYAEVSATNGDCIGKDAVGLTVRIDREHSPSGYSVEVSCDGAFRFRHHRETKYPSELVDWTPVEVINTGKEAVNRIGLWGYQGKFYFFINGQQVGEYFDSGYKDAYGVFSLYVRAAQTFDLTATFDDFAFWHIPFIP